MNLRLCFDQMANMVPKYVATEGYIQEANHRFVIIICLWSHLYILFLEKFVGGKRSGRAIRINDNKYRYRLPVAANLHAFTGRGF